MTRIFTSAVAAIALAVAMAPGVTSAQRVTRINDDQARQVIDRLERAADTYRSRVDAALDASAINGTKREDRLNKLIQRFEQATDALKGKFDDDDQATGAAREVLQRAARLDRFMDRNELAGAEASWLELRRVLDDLALAYNVTWTWEGAAVVDRVGDNQVDSLLGRLESSADRFRASLDAALDESLVDDTAAEDEINGYVQEFERATDRWKSQFGDRNTASASAEEVLARAQSIDRFMATHAMTSRAQQDWATLRTTLDELARAYNVEWNW
jgi:hypothetical protein